MAFGRIMQLTKQVGEYLVSAELCRNGLITTTFTGNVPDFDIIATNDKLESILIQVKTITRGTWQFNDVRKFIKIKFNGDLQKITGKVKIRYQYLVFIFVKLKNSKQTNDKFYILKYSELQQIIHNNYKKYLKEHNGRRPKKPKSTHTTIRLKDIKDYELEDLSKISGYF